MRAGRIDAVDVCGDFRRVELRKRAVVADAAQGERGAALVALLRIREARHELCEIGNVADPTLIQGRLAEDGIGHRRILHVGLALGGGDDDFSERVAGLIGWRISLHPLAQCKRRSSAQYGCYLAPARFESFPGHLASPHWSNFSYSKRCGPHGELFETRALPRTSAWVCDRSKWRCNDDHVRK